ncbi:hypothetical protein MXD63_46150, partial [Frankia sp. Cpl3]|nr:hypothetical protein [Frankia sp. Cpl3]
VSAAVLPVDFAKSATVLLQKYAEIQPDAVISVGLSAGRDRITPERIAINCNDGEADIPASKTRTRPLSKMVRLVISVHCR